MEKNFTDGSVFKNLALFSLPYLLSYFLQTLYGMADLFIIGGFDGTAATTSVSVGSQVMHMLTVIIVGLAMGSTVSIGNAVGAGKPKRAVSTLGYAIIISSVFSVAATVTVQFAANGMVGLFTDDNAVILSGGQYLKGYIWDCFFAGIHFSCSGYFCAAGKSAFSFLHNLLSIILVRIPGAYITSKLFTTTLLPMGLSSAAGSLFSIIICAVILAYNARQK